MVISIVVCMTFGGILSKVFGKKDNVESDPEPDKVIKKKNERNVHTEIDPTSPADD